MKKKSLVLFCLLSAACTTGGITMHRGSYVPSVTYDESGERRCGLVLGHHKNWLNEEVPDQFVADINVWWGTAVGAAQAAQIVAEANARLAQEEGGFMLACAEATAIEMTAKIHAGRGGKDKATQAKVERTEKMLNDLVAEWAKQEKAAQKAAKEGASPAAPTEQPSGQPASAAPASGQPTAAQPAAAAPAPAPDTACGKIAGAKDFAELAAGLARLATDTKDAELKRKLTASATAVKAAGSAGGDLEAYKTSFRTSYCR